MNKVDIIDEINAIDPDDLLDFLEDLVDEGVIEFIGEFPII